MTTKRFEIVHQFGRWAVMHGGQALATYDSEPEAERAAQALAGTQPLGDDAEIVIQEDLQ